MLNVGSGELLIIFLVALIFLGPTRLPQVARQLGQTMASLRAMASGFQAEMEAAAQPDRYDGPMHLPTPQTAEGAEPVAAADDGGTNLGDIAKAAREVDVDADADAADAAAAAADTSEGPSLLGVPNIDPASFDPGGFFSAAEADDPTDDTDTDLSDTA